MVDRIAKKDVHLPKCLDVLIHLPTSKELKNSGVCLAHALEYNISTMGFSPAEALEKLVNLVIDHCERAIDKGINPIRIADQFYWAAFALGEPMADTYAQVRTRVSKALIKTFGSPEREVEVRDVSNKQEESGKYDLQELAESNAL